MHQQLLDYISSAPTPYHAVESAIARLQGLGFKALDEKAQWDLVSGEKYYVTRRDSSLIAFCYSDNLAEQGLRMLGAHTDSPCLKVKPSPDATKHDYQQASLEVYGGVLLNPWFDRDLALAGKVSFVDSNNQLQSTLVDTKRPVAIIPSLAIHLDRTANQGKAINPQEDMSPILWQGKAFESMRDWLSHWLTGQGFKTKEILDWDLSFYDAQAGSEIGVNREFLACARLDNLLSCFASLEAIAQAPKASNYLLVLNDHEEVGSGSTAGAAGNFLRATLDRLVPDVNERHRVEANSLMLSVDNAHGVHPNFANKHDAGHGPILNKGPVLKFDANQSYATQSVLASELRLLARDAGVPLQSYVTRADMRCGSTIGPMTAAATGIETLDIGVPTFAMHSIRELCGRDDPAYLTTLLAAFIARGAQA